MKTIGRVFVKNVYDVEQKKKTCTTLLRHLWNATNDIIFDVPNKQPMLYTIVKGDDDLEYSFVPLADFNVYELVKILTDDIHVVIEMVEEETNE